MKLLHCSNCGDIFNLDLTKKSCRCGETWGYYQTDGVKAVVSAGRHTTAIGFTNPTFLYARINRPKSGMGERFTAFVMPEHCDNIFYSKGA
jgi:hypothetical protein